jgi:hypothetical protein
MPASAPGMLLNSDYPFKEASRACSPTDGPAALHRADWCQSLVANAPPGRLNGEEQMSVKLRVLNPRVDENDDFVPLFRRRSRSRLGDVRVTVAEYHHALSRDFASAISPIRT